jgi:hypothetical protein
MEAIQEVNLQELKEKYGKDLVEKLQGNIDFVTKNNYKFKIEVVDDDAVYFAEIAFVTGGYAYVYQVSLDRKTIVFETRIGWRACEAIAKIMEKL